MPVYDAVRYSDFDGACPVCGGQCAGESVRRPGGASDTVSGLYASCQSCTWSGPADLVHTRTPSPVSGSALHPRL
jgi:hypothetical protein